MFLNLLTFFIVLSVLVLIHEFGHFIVAKKNGVKVEEFGLGIPPRVFGKRFGETLYSINALPFGGFVKLFGEEAAELDGEKLSSQQLSRSFSHKSTLAKSSIVIAGVICNFLLGWGIISYLFTQGVSVPSGKVLVEKVTPSSPAQQAGLQKGDIIKKITFQKDVSPITDAESLIGQTAKYGGKEISIDIDRSGTNLQLSATPRKNPKPGQGGLGIAISDSVIKKYSISQAPFLGLKEAGSMTYAIIKNIGQSLGRLITFQKQNADIVGPVGIYMITAHAAQQGFNSLLQLMGLLSLNLAVVNILPFPALDGGRLVMILYTGITRKKINSAFEQKLNLIGFCILIGFILLITARDFTQIDHIRQLLK
ncbi:MAG: M50 family metallopeptidase [Candidatus Roizmanbacteria bacterium]